MSWTRAVQQFALTAAFNTLVWSKLENNPPVVVVHSNDVNISYSSFPISLKNIPITLPCYRSFSNFNYPRSIYTLLYAAQQFYIYLGNSRHPTQGLRHKLNRLQMSRKLSNLTG
jgi:hypothetical protein